MNVLILLIFLVLFLFAGKKLFGVRDWGKQPQYKGNRPGGIDMSSTIKICERIIEKLQRSDNEHKDS